MQKTNQPNVDKLLQDAANMCAAGNAAHAMFSIRRALELLVTVITESHGFPFEGQMSLEDKINFLLNEPASITKEQAAVLHRIRIKANEHIHELHSENASTVWEAQHFIAELKRIIAEIFSDVDFRDQETLTLARACAKRGEITKAEALYAEAYLTTTDPVTKTEVYCDLYHMHGLDKDGNLVDYEYLEKLALNGNSPALAAKMIIFIEEHWDLFGYVHADNIQTGETVYGILCGTDTYGFYVDIGNPRMGFVKGTKIWDDADYALDLAVEHKQDNGIKVCAVIDSITEDGMVSLTDCEIVARDAYNTTLACGEEVFHMFSQLSSLDPALANTISHHVEAIRPEVDRIKKRCDDAERAQIEEEQQNLLSGKTEEDLKSKIQEEKIWRNTLAVSTIPFLFTMIFTIFNPELISSVSPNGTANLYKYAFSFFVAMVGYIVLLLLANKHIRDKVSNMPATMKAYALCGMLLFFVLGVFVRFLAQCAAFLLYGVCLVAILICCLCIYSSQSSIADLTDKLQEIENLKRQTK